MSVSKFDVSMLNQTEIKRWNEINGRLDKGLFNRAWNDPDLRVGNVGRYVNICIELLMERYTIDELERMCDDKLMMDMAYDMCKLVAGKNKEAIRQYKRIKDFHNSNNSSGRKVI